MIIDRRKLLELVPKAAKFTHYKDVKNKSSYIHSIKEILRKNNVLDFFTKCKIRKMRQNMEIYVDVLDFLKTHSRISLYRLPEASRREWEHRAAEMAVKITVTIIGSVMSRHKHRS